MEAIARLPRNKEPGPVGLLNENLQQSGAIIPHIAALMNSCLNTGVIPSDWRKGLLSLHVWRKTLCAGMPAILLPTTNATTAEERT